MFIRQEFENLFEFISMDIWPYVPFCVHNFNDSTDVQYFRNNYENIYNKCYC